MELKISVVYTVSVLEGILLNHPTYHSDDSSVRNRLIQSFPIGMRFYRTKEKWQCVKSKSADFQNFEYFWKGNEKTFHSRYST